jgi:hypothetical protein
VSGTGLSKDSGCVVLGIGDERNASIVPKTKNLERLIKVTEFAVVPGVIVDVLIT